MNESDTYIDNDDKEFQNQTINNNIQLHTPIKIVIKTAEWKCGWRSWWWYSIIYCTKEESRTYLKILNTLQRKRSLKWILSEDSTVVVDIKNPPPYQIFSKCAVLEKLLSLKKLSLENIFVKMNKIFDVWGEVECIHWNKFADGNTQASNIKHFLVSW